MLHQAELYFIRQKRKRGECLRRFKLERHLSLTEHSVFAATMITNLYELTSNLRRSNFCRPKVSISDCIVIYFCAIGRTRRATRSMERHVPVGTVASTCCSLLDGSDLEQVRT